MWLYDKKLEYPIKIKRPDPKMANVIITQYGGPDGELGASVRYLSQRFSMITPEAKATLNDIGTEELAHLEMVGSMVKQLTENASVEDIKKAGMSAYYADHDKAVYPVSASGVPFSAASLQSKGDPITDLYENMAAEQKARSTYEYLINLADDPDVIDPLKFLREREIVHFQRFGESLRLVQDYLHNKKRFSYANTPLTRDTRKENANMPHMPAMPRMKTPVTGMHNETGVHNMPGVSENMTMYGGGMNMKAQGMDMPDLNMRGMPPVTGQPEMSMQRTPAETGMPSSPSLPGRPVMPKRQQGMPEAVNMSGMTWSQKLQDSRKSETMS